MYKLSTPSPEIVENIFNEVEFSRRLIGYRLLKSSGPVDVTLYSLVEALGLLCESYARIDLTELAEWIRVDYRDSELASIIKEISIKEIPLPEKNCQIREIIFERIFQCKEELHIETFDDTEKGD